MLKDKVLPSIIKRSFLMNVEAVKFILQKENYNIDSNTMHKIKLLVSETMRYKHLCKKLNLEQESNFYKKLNSKDLNESIKKYAMYKVNETNKAILKNARSNEKLTESLISNNSRKRTEVQLKYFISNNVGLSKLHEQSDVSIILQKLQVESALNDLLKNISKKK